MDSYKVNADNKIEKSDKRVRFVLPEIVAAGLLVIVFLVSTLISPFFLDGKFLMKEMLLYLELGVLAIALTPTIIGGNLDLSVASSLVMVSGLSAFFHARLGVPMVVCILIGLVFGLLAGWINGYMIAYVRLPWVTVTLGTMALYRGVAQILLGVYSIQDFPDWFVGINKIYIPGTGIPISLLIFLFIALITGLVLHKTVIGRWIYAIGTNEKAALFAGVPVKQVKLGLFMYNGLLAAVAGLMMISRLAVARYDLASGYELHAITAAVLGGTSINGGRGTIVGTVIAIFLVGMLQSGMGVANIKAESQLAVLGALLVIAVVISNTLKNRNQ